MQDKTTVYEFGDFRLDARQRVLSRGDEVITLTPKGFEILLLLIRNQGQILEKEELLRAAWPDTVVEESNLTQNIFLLRKVLGDDRNGHGLIQTIPRRGYRFVAPVREFEAAAGDSLFPAGYWNRHSPFRGLQVFEAEDSWLFFGRDKEIEELLEHLGRSPVLVLIGNSGSGKSSLARAGLVAALQQGRFQDGGAREDWRTVVVRPSGAPFDYLAEVLPGALAPEMDSTSRAQFIADCRSKFPRDENALRNAIGALVNADHSRVLLVVDQFEELFTLNSDRVVRDRYINLLLATAGSDSPLPVHIVLVLRADFYAQCLEHPALAHCLQSNVYNLPRMGRPQLRESIEKRLALACASAEAGLIDSLLEDAGEEPGNLALLEHALTQLWKRCGGAGCTLTNQAYSEIGRLRGALGRHADEVYQAIANPEQKQLAQRIFLELVHVGEETSVQETRRRVRKPDLLLFSDAGQAEELLAHLASNRLVAVGGSEGEAFIEISHEALIREWPRLREWLDQNREEIRLERRLRQAAEEWEKLGRDPGALLQGIRLARAEEWLASHSGAPTLLQQFIEAGMNAREEAAANEKIAQQRELARQRELLQQAEARAEAENQLRREQQASAIRLRWLSVALAIFMLIATGAAWFAHRQRIFAESRALAAQAEALLSRDHGRAVDLAIRSWELARTEEARLAVAKTFAQPIRIFQYEGAIYTASFSPDGQRILAGGDDKTAKVWSIDGQLLLKLQGHTDKIVMARFSSDGQRIVTASRDHTARVWNAADGRLMAVLRGHTDKLLNAHFSPDNQRIVTSSWDKTARIWNAANGRLLATLSNHNDLVIESQFSSDGRRVVSASYDKTAKVWDAVDGRLLTTLEGHAGYLMDARFFPKDDRVITGSWDGTARIWDSKGHQLMILQHAGPVCYVGFSPDGSHILTTSFDHTARIWDSNDGSLLLTLHHDGPVMYAQVSRDGRHMVTASSDHTARIWNATNGRLLAALHGHSDIVYRASFSPDGQQVFTASQDHTLMLWSMVNARSLYLLQGHTNRMNYGEFSRDDQIIVTAGMDGIANIWDTASGRLLNTLRGHKDGVWHAVVSPDGRRIATASLDHTARVWNRADGKLLGTLQGGMGQVRIVRFSHNGDRILTACGNGTVRIWSSLDYHPMATLRGHTGEIFSAAFSPDDKYVLTSGSDHTARLWDSYDGQLELTFGGHTGPVHSTFSRDGKLIMTTSTDQLARIWSTTGEIRFFLKDDDADGASGFSSNRQRILTSDHNGRAKLWDITDGHLVAVLQGHSGRLTSVAFSSDGRIITAGEDDAARIWDGLDGHLIVVLQGHSSKVWEAVFSYDGRTILTLSLDQTARLWRLLTLDDIDHILAN